MEVKRLLYDGFDWDEGNIPKAQKHGVGLEKLKISSIKNPWFWMTIVILNLKTAKLRLGCPETRKRYLSPLP